MNLHSMGQHSYANNKSIFNTILALSMGLSLSAMSLQSIAGDDDDYLNQLSEEISKPEYVDQARAEILASEKEERTNKAKTTVAKKQEKLKTVVQFEKILKSKYPASFMIYSELKPSGKNSVYSTYKSSQKLSAAKRKIVDLFLGVDV